MYFRILYHTSYFSSTSLNRVKWSYYRLINDGAVCPSMLSESYIAYSLPSLRIKPSQNPRASRFKRVFEALAHAAQYRDDIKDTLTKRAQILAES